MDETDKSMDVSESPLPGIISPDHFLARLWRSVNNPAIKSICWDRHGQVIIIDKHLHEAETPVPSTRPLSNRFHTIVFALFLHDFKEVDRSTLDSDVGDSAVCYFNPNFKRNHPELVASLMTLGADKRAKIQAALDASQFFLGDDGRDHNVIRGSSSLHRPTHQESPHLHYPNRAQAMTAHNQGPIRPQFLIRDPAVPLSSTVFVPVKMIPVPLSHHYPAQASSTQTVNFQQGLLARANQGNYIFNATYTQYQSGYHFPQVCHQNPVASHMTSGGLQTGLFPPHSYYQIADRMMPTPPYNGPVRPVTPNNQGPTLVPFPSKVVLTGNPSGTVDDRPSSRGPIIVSVTGNADLVAFGQQEASVDSVPERMPDVATVEVPSDDPKDAEVIYVQTTLRDTSQQ